MIIYNFSTSNNNIYFVISFSCVVKFCFILHLLVQPVRNWQIFIMDIYSRIKMIATLINYSNNYFFSLKLKVHNLYYYVNDPYSLAGYFDSSFSSLSILCKVYMDIKFLECKLLFMYFWILILIKGVYYVQIICT